MPNAKDNNVAAIRKRAQILKANRTMFLWIAVSSALVGSALVVSYFFAQKLVYNEKVLFEKNKTIGIINDNLEVVEELKNQIRIVDTNPDLATSKANEDDQGVQVILDALPSDANSLALGASLQSRLLTGISGLTIDTLQVDPVVGLESLADQTTVDAGAASAGNEITFHFSVTGGQAALKKVLQNLERSIRQIDVRTLTIESQGSSQIMTVSGRGFYEPAKTIELKDKVVPQ